MSKPTLPRGADAEERVRPKVADGPPGDCWPWTGTLNAQGHGVFWVDGRAVNPDEAVTLGARLEAWTTR